MFQQKRSLICGIVTLIGAISCIAGPFIGYQLYSWQFCWFPTYGPEVEIIVTACRSPSLVSVSPDGRYLVYTTTDINREKRSAWLRDVLTGEDRSLEANGAGEFWLNHNLMVVGRGSGNKLSMSVLDVGDNRITSIRWVNPIDSATTRTPEGKLVFSPQVVRWFRDAEEVYFIPWRSAAIALASNFKEHPEQNFFIESLQSGDDAAIRSLLQENGIASTEIQHARESSLISRSGRFRLGSSADGVTFYDLRGNPIAQIPVPHLGILNYYGWASDDSGVYVQGYVGGSLFLFEPAPPQQPILKVNLPLEYLSPEARQREEARQAQRQAEETRTRVLVSAAGILIGGAVFGIWWRRKREGR